MTIVSMQRVTVAARKADAPSVLNALQNAGCLHIVPLRETATPTESSQQAREALRHLIGAPSRRRPRNKAADFDPGTVIQRTQENRRRIIAVQEVIDTLEARVSEIDPWGQFELAPLEEMGGVRLWFYILPAERAHRPEHPHACVYRDERHLYVVLLSREEPNDPELQPYRSKVGTRSLEAVRTELERAYDTLEDLRAERVALTAWSELLTEHLATIDDRAARERAHDAAHEDPTLFVVSGWAPRARVGELRSILLELGAAVTCREPHADEEPPVALSPPPGLAPGADLLRFYQLPGYRDWDPSGFVYASFVVFFAMILADAAYSALLAVGTLLAWKRFEGPAGPRFREMLLAISVCGMLYGLVAGSYFGWSPPAESWLARIAFLRVDEPLIMMPIALGIGALHLSVANLAVAYRRRTRLRALSALGWVATFSGGYFAYLGYRPAFISVAVGIAAVLLFSSERSFSAPREIFMRLVDGVIALTGITRAFGDTLSYLRLFALGLASASLASTFNRLGGEVSGVAGVGTAAGLLVLVIGHGLNLVLGLVGGVVHGLRLNVIELYNWGIEGEGEAFDPLKRTRRLES